MFKFSRFFVLCLLFGACATPQKPVETVVTPPPSAKLDYDELEARLGMGMGPQETGYREKIFDACDLGNALNELKEHLVDCHRAYWVVLKIKLSCRESEESSEVLTETDLRPVGNQKLTWKLGKIEGESMTDASGESTIRVIAPHSQKKSYLRVSTGTDYLMMQAAAVTAIVTPPSWCGRR